MKEGSNSLAAEKALCIQRLLHSSFGKVCVVLASAFSGLALNYLVNIADFNVQYGEVGYSQAEATDPQGNKVPSQTRKNIEALKAAGWEVYDTPEMLEAFSKGGYHVLRNPGMKQAWAKNENDIKSILNKEGDVFLLFIDSDLDNDEITVGGTSKDNYLIFNIRCTDPSIGGVNNTGRHYIIMKQLSEKDANKFRGLSNFCPMK